MWPYGRGELGKVSGIQFHVQFPQCCKNCCWFCLRTEAGFVKGYGCRGGDLGQGALLLAVLWVGYNWEAGIVMLNMQPAMWSAPVCRDYRHNESGPAVHTEIMPAIVTLTTICSIRFLTDGTALDNDEPMPMSLNYQHTSPAILQIRCFVIWQIALKLGGREFAAHLPYFIFETWRRDDESISSSDPYKKVIQFILLD